MRILFALLIVAVCPLGTICQFNMTAYRQMPPLYELDDYDLCLDRPEPSSYCLVIGEIVPNETSTLWNQIANFSAVIKRHYRHDSLYFGVCLNPCKELVSPLSTFRKDQLYAGNIHDTALIEYFTDINQKKSDTRILNHKTINTCLNYKFEKNYGLQVRSFIQYCVSNNDFEDFNYLEISLMVLVGTLVFLVILSTNYDRLLKNKKPLDMTENEFYQQILHTQQDKLLTSFSLFRNYYRFITPSRNGIAKDLRFLECYRFFGTLLVVFAHVLLLIKSIPTANTEFVEKIFYRVGSNLFINGSVIIQVFLVMSSFFLCIGFQRQMGSKKPGLADWGKLVAFRYIRLVPSLAFIILLNASILPRLQDGPFWRHIVQAENVLCRDTWWANLLFINNFTLKKSCLHQTWYLATDFQLYMILGAVLIFIARFPHTRNYILGSGVVMSFLSTGLVTYIFKIDAIHQETPDSYRYLFWTNSETIYKGYTPFYTNFGGFFFGTIAAFIYLKYKNEDLNLKGKKKNLNRIIFLCIPLPFLLLMSGEIFYRYEFVRPSVWVAIYSGLYRNIWALMCAALILLMAFKIGSLLYKFSSMKIFVPLGRLSFQVFLIHTFIIRCMAGSVRQPIHSNNMVLITYILTSVVMSFFASFFLYMFIELPLNNLTNVIIQQIERPVKKEIPNQNQLSANSKQETTTA